MNLFTMLSRLFFGNAGFISFADADGAAGGDGSGGDGGNGGGSSSSDAKPDAGQSQIPTHDEKNVPYFERFKELERKYKDVDLDRYGRLKDFDPDEVEETFTEREKLNSELTQLREELAKAKAASGGKTNPEIEALRKEIADIKADKQKEGQTKWMQEFDSSTDKAVAESLKTDAFKDLGGKLSEFEKNSVRMLVDKVYEADAAGKKSLGIQHVPKVVEGIMKMVLENRKNHLGGMLKKDDSPQPINGSGNSGEKDKGPMTDEERVADSVQFLKDQRAGKVPV